MLLNKFNQQFYDWTTYLQDQSSVFLSIINEHNWFTLPHTHTHTCTSIIKKKVPFLTKYLKFRFFKPHIYWYNTMIFKLQKYKNGITFFQMCQVS